MSLCDQQNGQFYSQYLYYKAYILHTQLKRRLEGGECP